MAKEKITYSCNQCEYQSVKWFGCCPSCRQWDSLDEITTAPLSSQKNSGLPVLTSLAHVDMQKSTRMKAGISEWDRVCGGGLVPGSFIMLTGDPGIGKSTLLLQLAAHFANSYRVFYFSSEESLEQVKQRAARLKCIHEKVLFSDQAFLDDIILVAQKEKPDLLIIDSIQNCYTSETTLVPGSMNQLKESTYRLMRLAKEHDITIILSGHITKDGTMAGPKTLEHMVDTVLYLQGEDRWQTRILRSVKNRFGNINELGFFEMQENGLQEMPNINEHLLQSISNSPGSVLISYIEGTRPLLLELQVLTVNAQYGMPQRVISGIDHTQVVLIAAILEKYLNIKLTTCDIFFKVSGGFKIKGSNADLGIALALLSSFFQQALPEKCIALGELSLTGHIKPINQMGLHISEAEKFGMQHIFLAHHQRLSATSCKVKKLEHVHELLSLFTL
ncbi:MAG: DNA repair protein RadA [Candidatus Babeliaceae bacterium]